MKKRKSVRETKNMVQTALWLPRDVHERLGKEGAERAVGLGEEIRRRIQMSFDAEDVRRDPITRDLLDDIEQTILACSVDGQWYANHFNFGMLKAAINALISNQEPHHTAPTIGSERLQKLYGPDANPETVGRILAGVFIAKRRRDDDGVEPTLEDWGDLRPGHVQQPR
jgi:hypothetical protein